MECSICLENISLEQEFDLSCNHKIHYHCFLCCVYKTNGNIFIKCPLCREMNYNKKMDLSSEDNLKQMSFFKKKRCCHKTKKGLVCKNKSLLFNYGYCYQHSNNILTKEKHTLFCDFLYYLLEISNSWKTKVYMLDIGKQLIIKHPEINKVCGIIHYFFRYFHYKKNSETCEHLFIPKEMYHFYDLEIPPEEWVNTCITGKKFY